MSIITLLAFINTVSILSTIAIGIGLTYAGILTLDRLRLVVYNSVMGWITLYEKWERAKVTADYRRYRLDRLEVIAELEAQRLQQKLLE